MWPDPYNQQLAGSGTDINANTAIKRAREETNMTTTHFVWSVRGIAMATIIAGISLLQGCSVVLEATRPDPVDISQFQPGETHESVVERLGAPQSTAKESDGASCDYYSLYTHGPDAMGKAGIAFIEGAADVLTIGLAEVLTTPAEAATRNQTHPVTFCYRDSKLARVTEDGQILAAAPGPEQSVAVTTSAVQATDDSKPEGGPASALASAPLPTDTGAPAVANSGVGVHHSEAASDSALPTGALSDKTKGDVDNH